MKTPGVYIVEKDAFPNSVVEVASAIPAFIGYTEKAEYEGKSLLNKPFKLTSLTEYLAHFGGAPQTTYQFVEKSDSPNMLLHGKKYQVLPKDKNYSFFNSICLFFENGGGTCYIVSVGSYENDYDLDGMREGLELLVKEPEPTLIVIPEAVKLPFDQCIILQQAMLKHCGETMKDRVTILDIHHGHLPQTTDKDPIADFRNAIGINFLDYSMAYYPWLHTTIVNQSSLGFENLHLDSITTLVAILIDELITPIDDELRKLEADNNPKDDSRKKKLNNAKIVNQNYINELNTGNDKEGNPLTDIAKNSLNQTLFLLSPGFDQLITEIKTQMNLLPPSAAMAGVIAKVDNEHGVWKSPANVGINSVTKASVKITHLDQEDLNVTPQGKSINAIRDFLDEGTLVWGSRTLDGNSLDWRYISVRRTIIMLEESIKYACKAYVFESNNANTWITIKSMINHFLMDIWKRGGLAGTSPEDAFEVSVGLGETMTPEDILEGILRIRVLVAIARPAEFIEINFQQQMQQS